MEPRAHYVIVGLFTVIVASATLLFGLWLTKAGSERQLNYFDIIFNESVNGLSQGSPVQFSGIKVGDVTSLKLDPNNPNKVWARIRINASTPIRANTQAKLVPTSITGTTIIQLSSKGPSSPLLSDKNGKIPTIIATPSSFSKLLTNSEDLMININKLASSLSRLASTENIELVSKTLNNLEKITQTIADERAGIKETLQQVNSASKQLNTTLTQTSELTKNANAMLNNEGKQVVSDTAKTMASLKEATDNINNLLNTNRGSINNGMQGLNELGPALIELQKTLSSLRKVTNQLEQNPTGYLFGQDQPKEFKPQ